MNQYQVILRATNNNQEVFDLELTNVPQFLLDISAIQSDDIGKVYGISSQEFALPGTQTNNQFFNNLFDLGTTPAVSLTHTVPCQVLVDGQSVYTGKLYINNIITDQYNDVIYNCVVINGTIDFRTRIDNRALADLNFSQYDHDFTWYNISQSWNDNLFDGDIFYPLINYGKDPNNVNSSMVEFGGAQFQIDNPNYPLRVSDFKPAIRAKAVLDTVFDTVGYRYQSLFLTSSLFESLYVLTTPDDHKGAAVDSPISQSVYAYLGASQSVPPYTSQSVRYNTEFFDNSNSYDPITYTYTADQTGYYTIATTLPFDIKNYQGEDRFRFARLQIIRDSAGTASIANQYDSRLTKIKSGTIGFSPVQYNLLENDTITVKVYYESDDVTERFEIRSGSASNIQVQGPTTIVGLPVKMEHQFPHDIKVMDFFQSLITKFNLVIEQSKDDPNLLIIEPFNTWIDVGTIKDWTAKVDRDTKWQIEHPLGDQPKSLLFTDKLDLDVVNQQQFKTFGSIYGEHDYDSDSDLTTGTKK